MVGLEGLEPSTLGLKARYSAIELQTRVGVVGLEPTLKRF